MIITLYVSTVLMQFELLCSFLLGENTKGVVPAAKNSYLNAIYVVWLMDIA